MNALKGKKPFNKMCTSVYQPNDDHNWRGRQIEVTIPYHKSLLLEKKKKKNMKSKTAYTHVYIYLYIVYTCKISAKLYNIGNMC